MEGGGNQWPLRSSSGHEDDSEGAIGNYILPGQPSEWHPQLEHSPTTVTVKQEVLSDCEQEDEEDTGTSDQEFEALPVAVKLEVGDEFQEWPVAVKPEIESPQAAASHRATNQYPQQTRQSSVDAVVIKQEVPITEEMEHHSPLNDGDSGEEAAQWRPGQAATTPASSRLVARSKRELLLTNRKSGGGAERKPVLTRTEPMAVHSIAIQSGVPIADSCDVDDLAQRSRGASGQRPDAVAASSAQLDDEDTATKAAFKCDLCQFSCQSKWLLIRHIRTHSGEMPYQCQVCQTTFTRKDNFNKHSALLLDRRPHRCQLCCRPFDTSAELDVHARIHAKRKPYKCHVCNKTFDLKASLDAHSAIHSDDWPYKCQVCGKSYDTAAQFQVHGQKHAARPFKCHRCPAAFALSKQLIAHDKVHTDDKPCSCEVCKQAFVKLNRRRRHDTADKPFECQVCRKAYTHKQTLERHVRVHHGDE